MNRVKIYPYKMGSKSAKALARTLGSLRIRDTSNIRRKHVVINWGSSKVPEWNSSPSVYKILNEPTNVSNAINKLRCFEILQRNGIPCLEFTTNQSEALDWLDNGRRLISRSVLDAHSGVGIDVVNPGDDLPNSRMYTKYRKKKNEYRVFVLKDTIVDSSVKRRTLDWRENENFNKYVRNHCNGWIFCRDDHTLPESAKRIAVESVKALGLDFGAVEIGETRHGNCFVIEVNTAPSLDGDTTNERVSGAFKSYLREWL